MRVDPSLDLWQVTRKPCGPHRSLQSAMASSLCACRACGDRRIKAWSCCMWPCHWVCDNISKNGCPKLSGHNCQARINGVWDFVGIPKRVWKKREPFPQ